MSDLYAAVGRDYDVRGLQIAVDDALVVCGLECLGDLQGNLERVAQWHATAQEQVR
jgi:hypothetical protein